MTVNTTILCSVSLSYIQRAQDGEKSIEFGVQRENFVLLVVFIYAYIQLKLVEFIH